jgi:ABC-type uncharacterized transport system auxiliary subunit
MNVHDPRRRTIMLAAAGTAVLSASGCISFGGGDATAPTWYRLDDVDVAQPMPASSPASGAGAPRLDRVLLIGPVVSAGFYDSTMVAYSRAPGTLAHYQFAGWTERPGRRIGALLERRLAARARFAAVAQSTAGVRGDLLLNLSLEHLYHDLASTPAVARVALTAELLDWRARRLIARRSFEHSVPVTREAADAAVPALNGALHAVLDALCPWVEEAAAAAGASN